MSFGHDSDKIRPITGRSNTVLESLGINAILVDSADNLLRMIDDLENAKRINVDFEGLDLCYCLSRSVSCKWITNRICF